VGIEIEDPSGRLDVERNREWEGTVSVKVLKKMELARGIKPPTCGLQNLKQQNPLPDETPPKHDESDDRSTSCDSLWNCI